MMRVYHHLKLHSIINVHLALVQLHISTYCHSAKCENSMVNSC